MKNQILFFSYLEFGDLKSSFDKNILIYNKISTYIMIPYLAWSCYALVLNFSIWKLN
ncbi:MAG: hypothetical protein EBW08_03085 [Pelagibacteraceae bacterium]|nr:hypothetical protein [Pelagibacteraceae bacterium]